jgi:Protein of unknown function (DUF3102)
MTEHETTTTEPSLPTQLGFDYGQLVESDQRFVQERARNIKRLWEQTTANILRIGEELSEVKARLKHGHWLPWLNAEFGWSESSANNFMRAYSVFGSSNSQRVTDLARQLAPSAVYQLAAPSTPEAARQEVLAKVAEGEIPQPKQVKATIERHKPKRAPKPKTVDGDRPPELKRVEPPKPELVEGRDYRLVEDQYGFKHREPISAAPTLTSQQYRIAGALDILVRAIVNDPTVVADLEAVIADHEKTRAEAVADADAEDIAWHDLSLSVLRHLVSLATGGGESARTPEQPVPSNGGVWAERGARIRAARVAKGMNCLALRASVPPNVVSMVELGRLTKTGSPACGKPAIGKLEAALGIGEQRLHREQSGP